MKSILCFGDSLTWGYNPQTNSRFSFAERWPGILQKQLGNQYHIIEEGLNGRTTVYDDPFMPHRNGAAALPLLLETHAPLDLLIIMLGTNDLRPYRHTSVQDAAMGCAALIAIANKSNCGPGNKSPITILVAPPSMGPFSGWMDTMFQGKIFPIKELALHYERAAKQYGAHFFDASLCVKPCPGDGIHIDQKGHQTLGEKLAEKIRQI